MMNTELSGPGGYWIQMVRTSFFGIRPKSSIERMYDTLIGIRSEIVNQLRPNRKASEVATWVRNEITKFGFNIGVNFGHGLGLDVVERPLVHLKDETILKPGMVITVHPQLVSQIDQATVWSGDTYLISDGGAEILTKMDPVDIKILS